MKRIATILVIASGLGFNHDAFANDVYQCRDNSGGVVFSYRPCEVAPAEQPAFEEQELSVNQQLERIDMIDRQIARIDRQFRDMRLEKEASLREVEDTAQKAAIRLDFEAQTEKLIKERAELKHRRSDLVEGSLELMRAAKLGM